MTTVMLPGGAGILLTHLDATAGCRRACLSLRAPSLHKLIEAVGVGSMTQNCMAHTSLCMHSARGMDVAGEQQGFWGKPKEPDMLPS